MPPKKKPDKQLKNAELVTIRMDSETREAFERFLDDQLVEPERPAVVLFALRRLLAERGYLPKSK